MPYIALQLVGIQAVLEVVGLGGESVLAQDLPLLIAFAVLAAYTYSSGLRAPAMIAFVKDSLIYLVIAVAVIYLPLKLGGWAGIFDAAEAKMAAPSAANPAMPTGAFIPAAAQHWAYASLALGSALALFMYPHCVTATLSLQGPQHRPPQRGDPAGVLAAARPARPARLRRDQGRHPADRRWTASRTRSWSSRSCSRTTSRSWFAGVAFGAIAIGALVPAAIMSIAAANLFTRNIYKAYLKPDATDAQEAKVSKIVSLITKLGALLFVLTLDKQNALNFQLLGGVWILQTLPSIVFGLFTRWFHRWALLIGWAAGMIYGTVTAYGFCTACTTRPFGNSLAVVPVLETGRVHRADRVRGQPRGHGRADRRLPGPQASATAPTSPRQADYFADIGDPGVEPAISEDRPVH